MIVTGRATVRSDVQIEANCTVSRHSGASYPLLGSMADGCTDVRQLTPSLLEVPDATEERPAQQDGRRRRSEDERQPDRAQTAVKPADEDPGDQHRQPHCRSPDEERSSGVAAAAETAAADEPDCPERQGEAERPQRGDTSRDHLWVGRE